MAILSFIPASNDESVALYPCQQLVLSVVGFLLLDILLGLWWCAIVLTCISLMTADVENLFIWLFYSLLSEVSLKIFCIYIFLIGLFVFLLLSFKSIFFFFFGYMFFVRYVFANIFSQAYVLVLVTVSFTE